MCKKSLAQKVAKQQWFLDIKQKINMEFPNMTVNAFFFVFFYGDEFLNTQSTWKKGSSTEYILDGFSRATVQFNSIQSNPYGLSIA